MRRIRLKLITPLQSIIACVAMTHLSSAKATEKWDLNMGLQSSYSDYAASTLRKNRYSNGLFVNIDYLNKTGFSLIYNQSKIKYKFNIDPIKQKSLFASTRYLFRSDGLEGNVHLSLDGHKITNNDPNKAFDHVNVISPHLNYVNNAKDLAFGITYARSNYPQNFVIKQWTPNVGIAFNQQQDWLALKGYFIASSDSQKTQGKASTKALDLSITHYFQAQRLLPISNLKLAVLLGQRIYAVEDASVYNLADVQHESVSLTSEFQINHHFSFSVASGVEKYENRDLNDQYTSTYLYANLSVSF